MRASWTYRRPAHPRWLAVTGLVALALHAAACTGAGPAVPADDPANVVAAASGWQEMQDVSPYERGVLADRRVTRAELAQASEVLVECLGAQGILVPERDPGRVGPSGIVSEFEAGSDAEEDRLTAAEEACRAEVSAVEAVWVLQHEPTEAQRREAVRTFVDCLRGAGVDVPVGAALDTAIRAVEAGQHSDDGQVQTCLAAVEEALTTALPGLREALAAWPGSTG